MKTADDYVQLPSGRWIPKDSAHGADARETAAQNREGQLPEILVTDRRLREVARDGWNAVVAANDPPLLFQRGHLTVELLWDDRELPFLRVLDRPALRGRLDRAANFVRLESNKTKPARPPNDVVADMLAAPDLPLPLLKGIVGAPVFGVPGVLTATPGYQTETGLFLNLPKELSIPNVPDHPDDTCVTKARSLLLNDLLVDFPFVSDAERAHAVVILLLPFVRLLIEGPTPLHLIESPTPGSGKGLLVDVLTIPAAGRGPAVMTEGRDEDEWRKRITSKLVQGPQFILLDNIRSRLDSAALSAALTCEVWEDRILGHSRTAALLVTCVWLATANNPSLSLEVARRTVSVRLDADVERPWERTHFEHPNLRRWAKQHRGELIWAALTLVQAWIAAGKPLGKQILSSFEHWSEVMGGILEVAGIPSFLANQDRVYAEADQEVLAWAEFCAAWWEDFQDQLVTADLLFGLATRRRLLLDLWSGRNDHAARTRFGKALARMRDRVVDRFRLRRGLPDAHAKVQTYRLEPLSQARVTAPVAGVAGDAGGFSPSEKSSAGQQSREERSPSYTGNRGPADEISEESETPATPASPAVKAREQSVEESEDGVRRWTY